MRVVRRLLVTGLFGWFLVVAGSVLAALVARTRVREVSEPDAERVTIVSALRQGDVRNRSDAFAGGSVLTMFGRTRLDLRRAVLGDHGAHLEVTTLFGAAEISVPDTWFVTVMGPAVFGANHVAVTDPAEVGPGAPRLTISARTGFGGLEVISRAVLRATG
ncbi:MAG: LiaF-related protein [Acidimicrobiia bacterium]|jgi:predicted membrane protein